MAGVNVIRTPELRISLDDPRFILLAIGAVVLALFPYFGFLWGQTYLVSLVAKMLIFAIAAVSLDLILGYGGMVSFGHAAYIGLGAYGVAVFSKYGVDNGYLQLLASIMGSALVALFIGAISLRTSGVYFIMITLAFTQMLYYLGISLEPFGGDDGMNTKRSDFAIQLLGLDFTLNDNVFTCEKRLDQNCKVDDRDGAAIYYAAYFALIATVWLCRRLVASRFGMVIRGSMSNAVRMQAIGFPIYRYRLTAFVLAGAICGVAGFLFANHQQFLSPVYMNWLRSGEIMIMAILGGIGTIYGGVIGAIGLLTLEELLEGYVGRDYWQMIMGPLLVLLVLFANRGIWGLLPHRLRDVPMFIVRTALFVVGIAVFVWLMSKSSPILKIASVPHLPLYVIFAGILVALGLRFLQESRARHG
ncbi:MAG: branched-chain amino acid ABC transporter permease [Rhodospirillaceae bacterium]|nr:branched-chain amino acid ABC transporter permease [Rhodospirillaceae bacterium]